MTYIDLNKYAAGKRLRAVSAWNNQITVGSVYEAIKNDGDMVHVAKNDEGNPGWYRISRFVPVEDEAPECVEGLHHFSPDTGVCGMCDARESDVARSRALSPGHAIRGPVRLNEAQREAVGKVDPYNPHNSTEQARLAEEAAQFSAMAKLPRNECARLRNIAALRRDLDDGSRMKAFPK